MMIFFIYALLYNYLACINYFIIMCLVLHCKKNNAQWLKYVLKKFGSYIFSIGNGKSLTYCSFYSVVFHFHFIKTPNSAIPLNPKIYTINCILKIICDDSSSRLRRRNHLLYCSASRKRII